MKAKRMVAYGLGGLALIAGSSLGIASANDGNSGRVSERPNERPNERPSLSASDSPGAKATRCTKFPGGGSHDTKKGYSDNGDADAKFWSYGDKLVVHDNFDNGRNALVLFTWCQDNGYWHGYVRKYGLVDHDGDEYKEYNMDFKEGRGIAFKVCELAKEPARSRPVNCGKIAYTHA